MVGPEERSFKIAMLKDNLRLAIRQIEFARGYTLTLLDGLDESDWFRTPQEGVSHIAWQVGHLAMAEYMLTMVRMRGKRPEDEELISKPFLRLFLKGTRPQSDSSLYPAPAEIRRVLDAVHRHALTELPQTPLEELETQIPEPYAVYNNKLGALFFCASHEMLHAGQIGLLRRLIGKEPIR
jgi:hypothetical protein